MRCPYCGAELEVELRLSREPGMPGTHEAPRPWPAAERNSETTFVMSKRILTLSREQIEAVGRELEAKPQIYYVRLADSSGKTRPVPIRPLVMKVLKQYHPGEFKEEAVTSQRAKHILESLGFEVHRDENRGKARLW